MAFAILRVPTTDGFWDQVTFWHMFRAVEEIAGGGDGDAPFQRFKTADLFKFLALTSVIQ